MCLAFLINNLKQPAVIFAGLFYLAACAPTPVQNEHDLSDELDSLLVTTLSDIQDFYITEVNITDLVLNGLKRLDKSFDDLTIVVDGPILKFQINHETISSATLTENQDDVEDLAFILAQFIEDTKNASHMLSNQNNDDIIKIFLDGILEPLDRFSRYAGPDQASNERDHREGFGGIGLVLGPHPKGAVVEVVNPGDPANAAGINEGDIIIAVNGLITESKSVKFVSQLLRGPENQSVNVHILRTGIDTPMIMNVGRKHIVPNTVFYHLKSGHPVIRISSFNQRTAKRIAEAVSIAMGDVDLTRKGLIIDLRNNPGGLLDQAVDTADLFLNSGMVSQIDGRNPLSDQLFFAESGDISAGAPIILLINGAAASAAEILAAALQDYGRALVVGTNSFGKGSVQTVLALPNTGELILTWAHFRSPKNYPLNEFGILPNICTASFDNQSVSIQKNLIYQLDESLQSFKNSRRELSDITPSVNNYRRHCPWQGTKNGEVEMDIAIYLLEHIQLYNHAISLITTDENN